MVERTDGARAPCVSMLKSAIDVLHFHLANCLWNDNPNSHKHHLANSESVSMLKGYGGLGIPNLRNLSIFSLASWIRRNDPDGHKSFGDSSLITNTIPID